MRTILLLILAAVCSSCAATNPFAEYPEVVFHNGSSFHATLLSKTDSMLLVDALCQSWEGPNARSTMGLCCVPVSAIRRIWIPERMKYREYGAIGAGIGAGLGALLGAVGYEKPERKPGNMLYLDFGWGGAAFGGGMVGMLAGGAIGTIAGGFASRLERTLSPDSPEDTPRILEECCFPVVPPGIMRSWTYTRPGTYQRR